jgi:hypothetical protein
METTEEKKCCENKTCRCPCHKMGGVFILLIGVAILLRELDVFTDKAMWITIAILVILVGLKKICCSGCKCCDKP